MWKRKEGASLCVDVNPKETKVRSWLRHSLRILHCNRVQLLSSSFLVQFTWIFPASTPFIRRTAHQPTKPTGFLGLSSNKLAEKGIVVIWRSFQQRRTLRGPVNYHSSSLRHRADISRLALFHSQRVHGYTACGGHFRGALMTEGTNQTSQQARCRREPLTQVRLYIACEKGEL